MRPASQLGEEVREHALTVLGLEAGLVQRDAEFLADAARILEVGGGRAVAVVVLGPVRHEEGLDAMARIQEEGGGDRRVDASRETDDDARHGVSPPPADFERAERHMLQQIERVTRAAQVVVDREQDQGLRCSWVRPASSWRSSQSVSRMARSSFEPASALADAAANATRRTVRPDGPCQR